MKKAMYIVTAASLHKLLEDPRTRRLVRDLADKWKERTPEEQVQGCSTMLGMLEPLEAVVESTKVSQGKRLTATDNGTSIRRVKEVEGMLATLRRDILKHTVAPLEENGAQWKALVRFTGWLGQSQEQLAAAGFAHWKAAAEWLLTSHLQALHKAGRKFTCVTLGYGDTLDGFMQELTDRARLREQKGWRAMRRAWAQDTDRYEGEFDTTAHQAACLSALETMLEVVEVEDEDGLAEACKAWVEANLNAAREAGGVGMIKQERGWLVSDTAKERFRAAQGKPKLKSVPGLFKKFL